MMEVKYALIPTWKAKSSTEFTDFTWDLIMAYWNGHPKSSLSFTEMLEKNVEMWRFEGTFDLINDQKVDYGVSVSVSGVLMRIK